MQAKKARTIHYIIPDSGKQFSDHKLYKPLLGITTGAASVSAYNKGKEEQDKIRNVKLIAGGAGTLAAGGLGYGAYKYKRSK